MQPHQEHFRRHQFVQELWRQEDLLLQRRQLRREQLAWPHWQHEPEPEPPGPPPLPPGWRAVWHAAANRFFHADYETQHSVWRPRPRYNGGDWRRYDFEPAYWFSVALQLSFYEEGSDEWKRYVDWDDRFYWSCWRHGIRFYEPEPPEPDREPDLEVDLEAA